MSLEVLTACPTRPDHISDSPDSTRGPPLFGPLFERPTVADGDGGVHRLALVVPPQQHGACSLIVSSAPAGSIEPSRKWFLNHALVLGSDDTSRTHNRPKAVRPARRRERTSEAPCLGECGRAPVPGRPFDFAVPTGQCFDLATVRGSSDDAGQELPGLASNKTGPPNKTMTVTLRTHRPRLVGVAELQAQRSRLRDALGPPAEGVDEERLDLRRQPPLPAVVQVGVHGNTEHDHEAITRPD